MPKTYPKNQDVDGLSRVCAAECLRSVSCFVEALRLHGVAVQSVQVTVNPDQNGEGYTIRFQAEAGEGVGFGSGGPSNTATLCHGWHKPC